jgi:hypothetical protein
MNHACEVRIITAKPMDVDNSIITKTRTDDHLVLRQKQTSIEQCRRRDIFLDAPLEESQLTAMTHKGPGWVTLWQRYRHVPFPDKRAYVHVPVILFFHIVWKRQYDFFKTF